MFGFGGAARRKRVVEELAQSLPGQVEALHPVERATVLVLANSMLRVAAALRGAQLADDPAGAGAKAADAALSDLLPLRDHLASIVADPDAPNRRHATCHLRAAELASLTVGVGLDNTVRRACGVAWRAVWEGRQRLRDAVVWIRRYEQNSGVPAVPQADGEPEHTDVALARLGASVPAFLRKRA